MSFLFIGKNTDREMRNYSVFLLSVSLVVILFLAGIFLGIELRSRGLIYQEVLTRARAYFQNIVITREWNADYGGVYVEKKKGMVSNPYLKDPDITAVDGKVYTLKNPALMTREISEYAAKEGLFSFHITSLKLLNPHNRPDVFERKALESFEHGTKDVFGRMKVGGRTYFRYMAPLFVKKSCLQCHEEQGYKIGDVRGGISVAFDIDETEHTLRMNALLLTAIGTAATILLLSIIYFFARRLMKKLAKAQRQIREMAITDGLTGLYNSRHAMSRFAEEFAKAGRSGTPLGCIMMDIDYFKAINDTHGHLAGDAVLREVGRLIRESVRIYDIAGRFGGEEFLVVLPDTVPDAAKAVAEKIRELIRKLPLPDGMHITVSAGVAGMREGDACVDDIIRRADAALYIAKKTGRDKVESA
jgi:diguanylate cyclase (GGDEF)-like protein